ncbi:hypothetical protein C8R43DRAFT_1027226 [Mycena crocata]|nr:hypothetical protein C8R43DRAFT_1027226 [Mycena crocata]
MSTNPAGFNPLFPPELEREIFEIAAREHLPGISVLLLVAHRVRIWIEPILYETLMFCYPLGAGLPVISSKGILQLLDSRPASFFHDSVRQLLCADPTQLELETILAKCSGAHNIYIPGSSRLTFLSLLKQMAPRRLHVTSLFHLFLPVLVDYSLPLFARLTHLDLSHWDFLPESPNPAALPCLTHLAVQGPTASGHTAIERALADCPHLRVLLVIRLNATAVNHELSAHFAHDLRFVQMLVPDPIADWKSGAMGGEDCWSKADAIVRERKLSRITSQ